MKKFLKDPISSIIIGGGFAAVAAYFGGDIPAINAAAFGALVGTLVNGFKELFNNQALDVAPKKCLSNAAVGAVSAVAGSLACLL